MGRFSRKRTESFVLCCIPGALKVADRRAPVRTNAHSDTNIRRVANVKPCGLRNILCASPFTSNCQCAACKSCFAWSAAQPAVRTNWFIMTWCLSSSIFDEARVLLAATGSETDFRPLFLSVFARVVSVSPPQSSTITAGPANTNIYCRSSSGRDIAWLTEGRSQSHESIAGGICMLQAEGLGSAWL